MSTAVRPSPAQAWVLAARPKTLPAAAVPVIVGTAVAYRMNVALDWLVFGATLLAALLIQVGTNFANDYSDFVRGADHAGRLGPTRVTQSGLVTQQAIRVATYATFGVALLVGLYLAWVGGWPIVAIGSISIICGFLYTGGPWPLGYHGLGDLFVFLFFGVVAVAGTTYLQTGSWSHGAFLSAIPVGLLCTNILVVNNLRDIDTDRAAGKRTLAVRIGARATRWQFALFIAISFGVTIAFAAGPQRSAWYLLPWLSAPIAIALLRRVLGGTSGRDLNPVLERSGQLLLAFGVLLAAALVLSR